MLALAAMFGVTPWAAAMQTGGGAMPPKAAGNPLSALLQQKPKVPIEAPQLPAEIPELPTAIPLPEVAARSLKLSQQLREASSKLPTPDQLDAILTAVADIEPSLTTKVEQVNAMLAASPNSLEVREEESFWRGVESSTADWDQKLLQWANSAQATLNMLDAQEPAWSATLDLNKGNKELGPVLAVIENNLADIRKVRKQAQEALELAVNLQIRVGNVDSTATTVLSQLEGARTQLKGHLFDHDSLPLWRINLRRMQGENPSAFRSVTGRWISIATFLKKNKGGVFILAMILVLSLIASRKLCERTRDKQPADHSESETYRILRHWIAVGLLPPMMLGYVVAPAAPVSLLGVVILLSFFPILAILPPVLDPPFRRILYLFSAAYVFVWLISWTGLAAAPRREIEFFTGVAVLLILIYLVRPTGAYLPLRDSRKRMLLFGLRFTAVIWGVSLVANLLGYLKLAHYLALACIYSAFVAISIYTVYRVFTLLLTVGLRSPTAERLAIVRLHRAGITRWVPRVLKVLGVLIWLKGTFDLLAITDSVNAVLASVFDFHLAGGTSGATLGGVLGFFLILAVGYAVASSIRFFFREEILRRFHMSRGLPELIATIIYYLLMLMVVLAAVNAGGIELNKFTVLTGAFGVGVGFGLQNIINNFVSGLILQFERPIHIDDILEVDNNIGRVTRIGIRSSTIKTFQGAEVIIPNGNLISSKVINWTLSESQRRRELSVGVAYGTDPKVVLKILRDAAARHELVLSKPEPIAYFKGFGDSSLDFELHFWVMQENNGLQITSEVAVDINQSLADAGIEIPFPQRDLHLRTVDRGAGEALRPSETNRFEEPTEV